MKRRDFLKMMGSASVLSAMPWWMQSASAAETKPWEGLCFLTIIAQGGIDQSSWTDPRANPEINTWANTSEAGFAGRLAYAPIGNSESFFNKYHNHMLVFNGLDAQTGSHSGAYTYQNTGKLSAGYPSTAALHAAINGQGLPLPWVVMSGESFDGNIQTFTRFNSGTDLRSLADPNRRDDVNRYVNEEVLEIVNRYRIQRLQAMLERDNNLPLTERKLKELLDARANRSLLDNLANQLPTTFDFNRGQRHERVKNSIHKALVLFKAGVTVSASMRFYGGWDTHSRHDDAITDLQNNKLDTLDYLWEKAEELGVAERLVVHVTTDVGRRPYYNSNGGKDHWQTTTSVLMMKNAPWADRVVGLTGPKHEKSAINPATFEALPKEDGGILLHPSHVHQALRQLLNIDGHPLCQKFSFDIPALDVLNPGLSSPVNV